MTRATPAQPAGVTVEGWYMFERHYLDDCVLQLRKLKSLADKALEQVEEPQLFAALDPEANSLAVIMKHMAGNMRSRWADFLTTDGEKADRNRDGEFELNAGDTRDRIFSMWEEGWQLVLQTVSSLTPEDLARTVRIRGEQHSVVEAINRQMTHYAAHVGQIVLLAKHHAGANWRTLSVPRGMSRAFDASKRGAVDDATKTSR